MKTFVSFNHKVTFKLFNLANNFLPASKIEIADTKVNTLHTDIIYNVRETFFKLYFDIVVYPSHTYIS